MNQLWKFYYKAVSENQQTVLGITKTILEITGIVIILVFTVDEEGEMSTQETMKPVTG